MVDKHLKRRILIVFETKGMPCSLVSRCYLPPPNPVHYLFKFFVNWVESKYICLRRRGAGGGGGGLL